jgi:hypothetical protein
MARARDFGRVAVGARVVPLLQIGIDDLVPEGNDTPAQFRFPGSRGQRRGEDFGGREYLGSRLEFSLFARKIESEEVVEVGGI